jgi:tRNA nucleotidyltransferase (CCA-adding enzyme)
MHPQNIKLMLKLERPSVVLEYLHTTRKLDSEIANLVDIPQDSKHHPEGDAFIHTLMVLDEAADISRRYCLDDFSNAVLRLAAICHDMGKVTNTQIYPDGRITAFGHAEAGKDPAFAFLTRSKVNSFVIDAVLPLVVHHMAHIGFYTPDINSKAVRRLIARLNPATLQMLAYIIEADMSGRGGIHYKQGLPDRMYQILKVAETLNDPVDRYPDPLLSGDDIMHLTGIEPSPFLGKVKDVLYKAQLDGRFRTKDEGILFLLQHVILAEKS